MKRFDVSRRRREHQGRFAVPRPDGSKNASAKFDENPENGTPDAIGKGE
jgi:hypothetical protein